MSRYVNVKQLAFLVFVAIALWVGRRYNMPSTKDDTVPVQVTGTLQDATRTLPYCLAPIALCRQDCYSLSDSSMQLIIQYGTIDMVEERYVITGRDMSGVTYTLTCSATADTLWIQEIKPARSDDRCLCVTTEPTEEV